MRTQTWVSVFLMWIGLVPAASAATFTVNTTTDDVDAVPSDGLCETVNALCTLRAYFNPSTVNSAPSRRMYE